MSRTIASIPGIKAVLFDIYGTLLASSAGERHTDPDIQAVISGVHARSPHPFPEVDIREIHASLRPDLGTEAIEALAFQHENAVNPVHEMSGAAETLQELRSRGIHLGLISNAQFYTVPVLEECLGQTLEALGVDPGICVFSYEFLRAKPDAFLFEHARDRLASIGITPEAVLYIGNDVRNDIEPAKATGFRTALFAGDDSSLRLRGKTLAACGADIVLRDLRELL